MQTYFDPENETLPREQLKALQLVRLKATVERCYETVPFYRAAMDELQVKPRHIKALSDVRHLPMTKKEQLRDNYPFGMFSVPKDQILRLHASSGTSGKPVVAAYTRRDLETWARLGARCLVAAGLKAGDKFHNAHGYGIFTGGLGVHGACEMLGLMEIPMSGGRTQFQVMMINDLRPDGICASPSYAMTIAEEAGRQGIDMQRHPLRVGLFGSEPWTDEMRQVLEVKLGIDARDLYGMTEMMGPGVGIECAEKNGLHLWEDHFLVECTDIDTGEVLPPGEKGEIVITSLRREAFPMLRFRTRDITVLDDSPCPCGRTHIRMKKVMGRSDDMLIIRGVNVFPSQIEAVLMKTETLSPFYQIEVFRKGFVDSLRINVEASPPLYGKGADFMEKLAAKVKKDLKDYIGLTCEVAIRPTGAVERAMGKAIHVIDYRSSS